MGAIPEIYLNIKRKYFVSRSCQNSKVSQSPRETNFEKWIRNLELEIVQNLAIIAIAKWI